MPGSKFCINTACLGQNYLLQANTYDFEVIISNCWKYYQFISQYQQLIIVIIKQKLCVLFLSLNSGAIYDIKEELHWIQLKVKPIF